MSKTNKPRSYWLWWLLGITLLLTWQYWGPHDPAPSAPPTAVGSPDRSGTQTPRNTERTPDVQPDPDTSLLAFLPAEARHTIILIQHGGPFPYQQDGSVFGNREGHLPPNPRGWYHEYTVKTPGLSHRGTHRIITGGNPPVVWYYSSDHYNSFRAFNPEAPRGSSR